MPPKTQSGAGSYVAPSKPTSSRSKASKRRLKLAKQAAASASKALAAQKATDAAANKTAEAKAVVPDIGPAFARSSFGKIDLGATSAQAAEAERAQARFAAQAAAAQKEAARVAAARTEAQRAAAANKFRQEEAQRANMTGGARADQLAAAAQAARMMAVNNPLSVSRMGSVKPKPRPSVTNDQGPLQKAYNDFLMDIGARDKTQDYYDRLSDRKDASKKEQDRLRDKRFRDRDRDRARSDTTIPPIPDIIGDPGPDLPPEIVDPFRPPVYPPVMPPQFPQYPGYGGGMMGGIGAFGYNPALMQFESQQGAGQVPYYMAAARNAQTPNMSPAFMHAARNYDILGGSQRTTPRPMEMMSAAERAQIAGMGSNFNAPNYNSPYDQFNFFSNMVGGGGGGGKGMGRSAPQMAGGLGAFYGGFG